MTQQPAPTWQPPEPTPGPAPGVHFADHGPRLVAYIIDGLIVGALVIVALIVWAILAAATGGFANSTLSAGAAIGVILLVVALSVIGIGYFPWYWSREGATPGMKMMGLLLVRDADGGPLSGGQAILRLIGYMVSGMVFQLGYVWILVDKRHRGWHDLIAGTVMIKRP